MTVLIWLLLAAYGYAALALWVAHLMNALRRRQTALIVGLLLTPVVLLLVLPLLPSSARVVAGETVLGGLALLLSKLLAPQASLIPQRDMKPTILHLAMISGSALFLIPFFWLIITSLKEDSQMAKFPPEWVPTQQTMIDWHGTKLPLDWATLDGKRVRAVVIQANSDGTEQVEAIKAPNTTARRSLADLTQIRHFAPVWRNYPDALHFLPPESRYGLLNLQNTLVIALMSVLGTVLSSSLVAYGFSRLNWPGRDWLFGLVLATMMLPDAVMMMPRFLIFRSLHWIDTLYPLWAPSFFASAFNIFLLRQFFLGIPRELEEAAKIDGCGYFATYWRIMMPMVKPALAAVAVTTFIGAWKDFLGPLIYISSPEKMPLSYVLQLYNSAHGGEPGMLMAATTLVVLPVVVLFFFTQRYFIEGVTLTGLGGR